MKLLLKGIPASVGKVSGKARVISLSKESNKLEFGEILVVKITDAQMFVDIMTKAKGLVTDLGGVTSNPAIVSRELGIPCVVATQKATNIIKTGMKIVVDGEKGEVYESD